MGMKTDIIIGLVVVSIILLIVSVIIASWSLAAKALGILFIMFGLFMMFGFPGLSEIQEDWMGETGIIIGLVVLVIGLAMIFL